MNTIEHGPYKQQITDGLDLYKATMSQIAYEKHPDVGVTFELKNRNAESLFAYVEPKVLQERLGIIAQRGFSHEELTYLSTLKNNDDPLFSAEYLSYLAEKPLPQVAVGVNEFSLQLHVEAQDDWPLVSFWETVVMAEINELYFETYLERHGISATDLYDEGDARLTEKIETLQANPDIKFADFGTRRHFSYRWQKHVVERLAKELPGQFLGSSNIGLSSELGMQPIGTFAHEMPMVYAAIADKQGDNIRASHGQMLDDWYERYGEKLSIALTDTFGSDFFFEDFGTERAAAWRGVRHDSGDPVAFGEKTIAFYAEHGIDPSSKTIVFSDGLDINDIVKLHEHFAGRINVVFGWGTSLTNDLGLPALNIVMKAVEADGAATVKLSDVATKHTGDPATIEKYHHVFG
jgi:nicotinate phosphoribosyltransferase